MASPRTIALIALFVASACVHRRRAAPPARDAAVDVARAPDAAPPPVVHLVDARVVVGSDGEVLVLVGGETAPRAAVAPVRRDAGRVPPPPHRRLTPAERAAERALAQLEAGGALAVESAAFGAEPELVRGAVVRAFALRDGHIVPLPAPPRAVRPGPRDVTDWYTFDGSTEPVVVASDPVLPENVFAWTAGAWTPATPATRDALALPGVPTATTIAARGPRRDAVTLRCQLQRYRGRPEPRACRPVRVLPGAPEADAGVALSPGAVATSATGAAFLLRDECDRRAAFLACPLTGFAARVDGTFGAVALGSRYQDLDAPTEDSNALAVDGESAIAVYLRAADAATPWSLEAWRWGSGAAPTRLGPALASARDAGMADAVVRVVAVRAAPLAALWTVETEGVSLLAGELRDGRWETHAVAIDGRASGRFTRDGAVVVAAHEGDDTAPLALLRYANGAWRAGESVPFAR